MNRASVRTQVSMGETPSTRWRRVNEGEVTEQNMRSTSRNNSSVAWWLIMANAWPAVPPSPSTADQIRHLMLHSIRPRKHQKSLRRCLCRLGVKSKQL